MIEGDVLETLCARGVVPVVVLREIDDAAPLAAALTDAGLPVAEVTFRSAVAADAIRAMSEASDVLVGAGTVVRPEQVDAAVDAGARFVVSPGFSAGVVTRCRERGVPVVPGVATASEVIAALEFGLDLLKLFPAMTAGGVGALKAFGGPFPEVRWIPTGGVNAANLADYLALSSVVAVGGSWMVAPELVAARDFPTIRRLSSEAVALAAEARR